MTRRVGGTNLVKSAQLDQSATEVPELIRDTIGTALAVPGGQSYLIYTANDGADTYTISISLGAFLMAAGINQPVLWNGTSWPATRAAALLPGYTGKLQFDSQNDPAAPAPTIASTGDLWDMVTP